MNLKHSGTFMSSLLSSAPIISIDQTRSASCPGFGIEVWSSEGDADFAWPKCFMKVHLRYWSAQGDLEGYDLCN